jgi:hypothetical protein
VGGPGGHWYTTRGGGYGDGGNTAGVAAHVVGNAGAVGNWGGSGGGCNAIGGLYGGGGGGGDYGGGSGPAAGKPGLVIVSYSPLNASAMLIGI